MTAIAQFLKKKKISKNKAVERWNRLLHKIIIGSIQAQADQTLLGVINQASGGWKE